MGKSWETVAVVYVIKYSYPNWIGDDQHEVET